MATFVVGDIHGHLARLQQVFKKLPLKEGDTIIFLGDYGDRGPDTKGVIDWIINLERSNRFDVFKLMGNHESLLIEFLAMRRPEVLEGLPPLYLEQRTLEGYSFNAANSFRIKTNGAEESIRSYGVEDFEEFIEKFPDEHIEFLQSLYLCLCTDDLLLVHASVALSDEALAARTPEELSARSSLMDLLWSRALMNLKPQPAWDFRVVFGHQPVQEPLITDHWIALDVGAANDWDLAVLSVEERKIYFSNDRPPMLVP